MSHNIQTRLTRTYIGLAVIPLIVLGLLVTWQGIIFQQEAISRQEQLAKRVSAETDGFFMGLVQELELVIQLEGASGLSQQSDLNPLFSLITHDDLFEEITYIDQNGNEQNHETRLGIISEEEEKNHRGTKEFQTPFADEIAYFSPIHKYPITGEPVITISVPVKNQFEGRTEGVLLGEARLINIWDILASIPLNKGQSVYIIDANGQIIAHPNRSVVLRETFFSPPNNSGITTGVDSSLVFLAIEPVQLGPQTLRVVVEQSISEAIQFPLNTIGITVVVSLVTLGVAIYLGLRSVRQIVHPIQELASTARAIRAGEWQQQVKVHKNDELGDLGEAFNLMISRLQTSMTHLEEEVAERIHAEESLRKAEAHYRTLVEQLPAITYIDDATGIYGQSLYISPQVETILGISQDQWINSTLDNWLHWMHPQDHDTFLGKYKLCYSEGFPLECEYRMIGMQGQMVWFHDRAFRLNDQEGRPWIIQGVMIDITERKKAEEEIYRLNAELEQRVLERTAQLEDANKELESFTYSISHDLRTPLRGIIGFSSLLLNNSHDQHSLDSQHYLTRVRENAQRMGELVDDLLKFSRLSRYPITKRTIQPDIIAQEALDDLSLECDGRKMNITIGNLPPCQADPSLLRQVFTNLISNAIKYTRNRDVAQLEIGWTNQNNEIAYFVRDNGTGFDMQYADKLFGVFQRLHSLEDFEGTGVGLAITHRIIQRHGGRIWAEAELGKGATFYFTL